MKLLNNFYVSFVDILGFSEMVTRDCQSPAGAEKFLGNLWEAHKETVKLKDNFEGMNVVQFSDSIVISAPFSRGKFSEFIDANAEVQRNLFLRGILCRGGIAYGKHFAEENFIFSDGLIEAYRIESKEAKFPRIAVSEELLELLYIKCEERLLFSLIPENDGVYFVDYLEGIQPEDAWRVISSMINSTKKSSSSVMEKIRWLIEYYNAKFPESVFQKQSRFLFQE